MEPSLVSRVCWCQGGKILLFLSTEWTHWDGAMIAQNIKAEICDSFNAGKINNLQFYKWAKVMMIIISPWIIYRDMNSLDISLGWFCYQEWIVFALRTQTSCTYINVQHCISVEALELSCTHGLRKAVLPRSKWIVSKLRSQATFVTIWYQAVVRRHAFTFSLWKLVFFFSCRMNKLEWSQAIKCQVSIWLSLCENGIFILQKCLFWNINSKVM